MSVLENLPPELLVYILSFFLDPLPPVSPWARKALHSSGLRLCEGPENETTGERVTKSWLIALGVCRYWRSIILSQTSRPFPLRRYTEVNILSIINSTHPCLLDFHVDLSSEKLRETWEEAQAAFREHGDRFHTLDIWLSDPDARGMALLGPSDSHVDITPRPNVGIPGRTAELMEIVLQRISGRAESPPGNGPTELFQPHHSMPNLHTLRVTGPICSNCSNGRRGNLYAPNWPEAHVVPAPPHISIPPGLFDTLREIELCNCSLSSIPFWDAKALRKLSLIAVQGVWSDNEAKVRPDPTTLFSRLEVLCLVNESLPSDTILKDFGKIHMPRLGLLYLGGTLERVADFLNAISFPTSTSLDITCLRDSREPAPQQSLMYALAYHFAPARASGDFFTQINAGILQRRSYFECSIPSANSTVLHQSSFLSVNIVWDKAYGSGQNDTDIDRHLLDAFRLLPLEGCNKSVRLQQFPSSRQIDWVDILPLLRGTSKLRADFHLILRMLAHFPASRDAYNSTPAEDLVFPDVLWIMHWSRFAIGLQNSQAIRSILYSPLSNELSGRSAIDVLRFVRDILGRELVVYYNDEKIDLSKDM